MPYGTAPSATIPTVGSTVGPTYATQVNAVLAELRTIVGAKVTPTGIDINADLSFRSGSTDYGLTNVDRVSFAANTTAISAVTYPGAAYKGPGGEFFFNDDAGNQVQLTSGGATYGAAGNVTGSGYGIGGVTINWDSGNLLYEFKSGASTWADLKCDDVLLNDGDTNFVRLTAQAMAADYTVTFPAAAPASTSIVQMSSAGTLTASPSGNIATTGTVSTGALTATSYNGGSTSAGNLDVLSLDVGTPGLISLGPIVGTVYDGGSTTDGDLDLLSLDVGATGIISAGGLVCTGNASVVVAGTGRFRHGTMELPVPARAFHVDENSPNGATLSSDTFFHWLVDSNSTHAFFSAPLVMPVGTRILSIALKYFGQDGVGTRTVQLKSIETSTDTIVNQLTATGTATTGNQSIAAAGAITITTGFEYILYVDLVGEADADCDYLKMVVVGYDFP